jgi:peptidoglycan/LPS O-acetylase OafA/YrhL
VALDHIGLRIFSSPLAIYAGPSQQELVPANLENHLTGVVIAANALFLQTIFVGTAGTNDSLWSLTNEFWYYICFPALLLSFSKENPPWKRCGYLLLAVSILLMVGRSIGLLFPVWILGALICVPQISIPRRRLRLISVVIGSFFPVLLILVRRAPLPIYAAEWIVALYSSLLIFLLVHQTQPARRGLYQKVASFTSRISYTLYLVHLPLAVILCACVNTPWHRWSKSPQHLAMFVLLNASLVLIAYVFYLTFEANTERVRRALTSRSVREWRLPNS